MSMSAPERTVVQWAVVPFSGLTSSGQSTVIGDVGLALDEVGDLGLEVLAVDAVAAAGGEWQSARDGSRKRRRRRAVAQASTS